MFNSQILEVQNKLSRNLMYTTTKGLNCTGADIDLQYELYSKYMHLSKQQIVIQELLLMRDSQSLLETIGGSGRFSQAKDASSTMDSLSYDQDFDHSIMQQFSCTTDRRTPRKITRKGTRHSAMKATGRGVQQFNQMLLQIERHCTLETYSAVKSLLEEHKKNLSQMIQVQKKHKNLRKMEEKTEKAEEENLVLKMKLNEVEEKLKIKEQEIKGLKERLNQLKTIQKESMLTPQKPSLSAKTITQSQKQPTPFSHNQTNFLTTYLTTKQTSIQQRMTKIQSIETKIQSDIENAVLNSNLTDTACNKCCQMIKKIKQSVINYRTYLEEEYSQCQKMYNMLKDQVEECLGNNNGQLGSTRSQILNSL